MPENLLSITHDTRDHCQTKSPYMFNTVVTFSRISLFCSLSDPVTESTNSYGYPIDVFLVCLTYKSDLIIFILYHSCLCREDVIHTGLNTCSDVRSQLELWKNLLRLKQLTGERAYLGACLLGTVVCESWKPVAGLFTP